MRRVLLAIAIVAAPSLSRAQDPKLSCIENNTAAQRLEHEGKLREASEKLVACAATACPMEVRSDCAAILARVTSAQPTFAVQARDEHGADTAAVRVLVDGEPVADHSSGRALPVDPGEHLVRVELGAKELEQRIVFVEGQKERSLVFDFTEHVVASPPPPPLRPLTTPVTTTRFRVPLVTWVVGGVGLAAAGGFAYFALSGLLAKNALDATCHADLSCSPSQYDDVSTRYYAADAFVAVAGASLVAAVITLVAWPRAKPTVSAAFVHGIGLRGVF